MGLCPDETSIHQLHFLQHGDASNTGSKQRVSLLAALMTSAQAQLLCNAELLRKLHTRLTAEVQDAVASSSMPPYILLYVHGRHTAHCARTQQPQHDTQRHVMTRYGALHIEF
eukprot:GHUV01043669.1.p2 GENE.GHUV01043669.1~~GHUV01043669.1.p2  ORF type:complete len:113 (+),score=24.80 GHUV01043669.1:1080-1418(+)